MRTSKTNTELLQQLQKGDRVAFYHIYERYCKRLYGFVIRYVKQEADAEEIVQEVFVKIWESRNKIDIYASFESFLFTIAYNATITLFRKRTREEKYLEHLRSIQEVNASQDLNDEVHFNELNEKVKSLIGALSLRQQEIYRLSREEGLSHNEIAQKLGITLNTVKKHISNTLAFLRTHLDSGLISSYLFVCLFF